MKNLKKKAKGLLALLMTLTMLVGACLPVGALGVSQEDAVNTDELAWSLTYEDGKFSFTVNPDTVYRILKDKSISKEELKALVPSEILDAAAKGRELTLDDLKALASNYVTLDELKALINDLPRDIVAEYVSLEKLKSFISVEEILNLIPLEEMMNGVKEEALKALLTDEVMKLVLKDELIDKIATDEFVSGIMNETTLVDDITTDPVIKAKLSALVTTTVVNELLADEVIRPRIDALVEDLDFEALINREGVLDNVINVVLDETHKTKLDAFLAVDVVEDKLIGAVDANILTETVITDLINSGAVGMNVINVLTEEQLGELINDDIINTLLGDGNFVQSAIESKVLSTLLDDDSLASDLVDDLADVGVVKNYFNIDFFIDNHNIILSDIAKIPGAIDYDVLTQLISDYGINVKALMQGGVLTIADSVNYSKIEEKGWVDADDLLYLANKGIDVNNPDHLEDVIEYLCCNKTQAISISQITSIDGISIDASKFDPAVWGYTFEDFEAAVDKDVVTPKALLNYVDGFRDTLEHHINSDTGFIKALKESVDARGVIVPYVKAAINNGTITMTWISALITDVQFSAIKEKINVTTVKGFLADSTTFNNVLGVVENSMVIAALDDDALKAIVKNSGVFSDEACVSAFITCFKPSTDGALINAVGGYDYIINNCVDIKVVIEDVITVERIFEFFAVSDIVEAVGTDTLMNYCDIKDIIAEAGGPTELAKLYSNDELTAIVNKIGTDNLTAFVKESGMLDAIDVKAIANDFIDLIKSKTPLVKAYLKECAETTLRVLMSRVDGIYFNGTCIFNGAQFDVNALLASLIRTLPDTKDFMAIGTDGAIFNSLLSFDIIYGDEIKTYTYGFEAKFDGDPSDLQSLVAEFEDVLSIDATNDLDVTLSVVLPEVVSSLYEKVLTSDRVPQSIKNKLVTLPNATVAELADALVEIAENEEVYGAINEKLDEIKAKAYDKIDSRLADNDLVQKAKAKVDEILDKFATKESYDKLVNKGIALVDKIVANFGETAPVQSLYEGNGLFGFTKSFSVDFIEVISKFVTLPEEAVIMFKSTEIAGNLDTTVGIEGLYELTVVDKFGDEFVTYLPAGISLEVLTGATGLAVVDENAEPVLTMPATDSVLNSSDRYYVQFVINGNVVENVFYNVGDTTVVEPDLETLDWEGKDTDNYTYEWEDYTLGEQQVTVVSLVATPIDDGKITVTFVDEQGEALGTHEFAKGTSADDVLAYAQTEFAKDGFTVSIEGYDPNGAEEQTVTVKYTAIDVPSTTINVTFVDEQGTTLGTHEFAKGTPEADVLAYAQTEFAKDGFTISIEGYDPNGAEEQTVTVKYTGNKYNVIWYAKEGDATSVHSAEWTFGNASTYPTSHPANPTRDGYTFKGWDKELNATLFATPGDIVIYGTWEQNTPVVPTQKITVTFVDEQNQTLGTKDFDKGTPEADVLAYAQTTFAKEGFTVSITGYDPNGASAQTVTVKYTAIGGGTTPDVPGGTDGTTEPDETTKSDTTDAIGSTDDDDDDKGSMWWLWLIIILLILIIAALVIAYFATRPTDEPEHAPEAVVAPEPEVEPETEPEVEPEAEVEPIVVPPVEDEVPVVDHVSAEEADTLMADDAAIKLVATKKVAAVAGGKAVVNLSAINAAFEAGETVTLEALKAKKLVPANTGRVKILGSGSVDKALNVEANAFSVQAVKMITLTGGSVTQVVAE